MDRDSIGHSHPSEEWSHQQRFQEVLDLRAKVAELTQQVERLQCSERGLLANASGLTTQIERLKAERNTLLADNARLAKDAERYRYIRNVRDYSVICESPGDLYLRMPEQLDAAIDAATAQTKEKS